LSLARIGRQQWPEWGRLGTARLGRYLLAGLLLVALPNAAAADELSRLIQQILRNPTNSELNLRYARLAEERKEWRWALAAYERILVNDLENEEARWGLVRVRRKLQPNQTQIFAEIGGAWESNPRRANTGAQSEWEAIARVMVRDERALGDTRWRTTGTFIAEAHQLNTTALRLCWRTHRPGHRPHAALCSRPLAGARQHDQRFFYARPSLRCSSRATSKAPTRPCACAAAIANTTSSSPRTRDSTPTSSAVSPFRPCWRRTISS
jgi:hypothetical protein